MWNYSLSISNFLLFSDVDGELYMERFPYPQVFLDRDGTKSGDIF